MKLTKRITALAIAIATIFSTTIMAQAYTGLIQGGDGTWSYVTADRADNTKTGLVMYDGAWFYVKDGQLDTTYNGLVEYDGASFIVAAGRVATEANGLWQNAASIGGDDSWVYAALGQVQSQYTGLVLYDGTWFYVNQGVLDLAYTGYTTYDNTVFSVRGGALEGRVGYDDKYMWAYYDDALVTDEEASVRANGEAAQDTTAHFQSTGTTTQAVGTATQAGIAANQTGVTSEASATTTKQVDVFLIAPTNVTSTAMNADITDSAQRKRILSSIGMQTGIYNRTGRFFSPYYPQATVAAYESDETTYDTSMDIAYAYVKEAFEYYMANENNGRPFIIAGFSQGAAHGLQLLKDYSGTAWFDGQLVAAYLIGWPVTDEDLNECPALKMAQGETDTGVIITFECEAEDVTGTRIVPEGMHTYSINPLTWTTDSTYATKELNLGYVYPASDGSVKTEIPQLCGCYIDPVRGTLKVTDVTPEDYPARMSFLPNGSYHIYDYEFFYRNLQENVSVRTAAYLG